MRWIGLVVALTVVGFVGHSRACGPLPLGLSARQAVAADRGTADAAVRSLRNAGPAGLDAVARPQVGQGRHQQRGSDNETSVHDPLQDDGEAPGGVEIS